MPSCWKNVRPSYAEVKPDMLRHSCYEMYYRWDICRAKFGRHIKV
jgi:hypothetical protein